MKKIIVLLLSLVIIFGVFSIVSADSKKKIGVPMLIKYGELGDKVTSENGTYTVTKVGEGIYDITDYYRPNNISKYGAPDGSNMYVVVGKKTAMLIDLNNNFIDGYTAAMLPKITTAEADLRDIVYGLAEGRDLIIGLTHTHYDHTGMTMAFAKDDVQIWVSQDEDLDAPYKNHGISKDVFTTFKPGQKTFDLGGGRVLETVEVIGHTKGGCVYVLKEGDNSYLFTGDAIGSGIGVSCRTADQVKMLATGTANLMNYCKTQLTQYQRYQMKIFGGHTWQVNFGGTLRLQRPLDDNAYLGWQFVQDMNNVAQGVIESKWLAAGSGLRFEEWSTDPKDGNYNPGADKGIHSGDFIYGSGAIMSSLKAAYEAAGVVMPK